MSAETRYEHVVLDNSMIPMIAGTTMKVAELALAHIAYGWSPEELHFQFPDLSLGKVYSALAYYWDHQEQFEQDLEQRLKAVATLRHSLGDTPLVARLKAQGLI